LQNPRHFVYSIGFGIGLYFLKQMKIFGFGVTDIPQIGSDSQTFSKTSQSNSQTKGWF
jgi:hypothetical protein